MLRRAVRVRRDRAEVALARLIDVAPTGVEERDVDGLVELVLYGATEALPDEPALREILGDALVAVVDEDVADDWNVRWMSFHEPVLVADRLYVRPPWSPPYPGDGAGVLDLVIDPAQAFGTGGHATTRLCLELLVALADGADAVGTGDAGLHIEGGTRGPVLDLGCGSGVLAVAAARLGWGPVHGVDNESASVAATVENARVNGVTVTASQHDLLRDGPAAIPDDGLGDRPPLVLANLLRPLLLRVAGDGFTGPPPFAVIASGLLTSEVDGVVAAFSQHGLVEAERRQHGDWAAVLLR